MYPGPRPVTGEHVDLRIDAAVGHAEHIEGATLIGPGDHIDGHHAAGRHEPRAVRISLDARLLRQGRDVRMGKPTRKGTERTMAEHHGPIQTGLPGLPELRALTHRQQRQQHRDDRHDADDRDQRGAQARGNAAQSKERECRRLSE